jgi:hypothetical protein
MDVSHVTQQRTNRVNDSACTVHSVGLLTRNSWYCYIINGRWGGIHGPHSTRFTGGDDLRIVAFPRKTVLVCADAADPSLVDSSLSLSLSPFACTQHTVTVLHTMRFTSYRPCQSVTLCHRHLYSLLQTSAIPYALPCLPSHQATSQLPQPVQPAPRSLDDIFSSSGLEHSGHSAVPFCT